MGYKGRNREVISASVPDDVYDFYKERSKYGYRSIAELAREVLVAYYEKQQGVVREESAPYAAKSPPSLNLSKDQLRMIAAMLKDLEKEQRNPEHDADVVMEKVRARQTPGEPRQSNPPFAQG